VFQYSFKPTDMPKATHSLVTDALQL